MKISYSNTFAIRNRCKKCGTLPISSFPFNRVNYIKDPIKGRDIKKKYWDHNFLFIKNTPLENYILYFNNPRFIKGCDLFIKMDWKSINVPTKQYHKGRSFNSDIAYLCSCQTTMWVFPDTKEQHSKNRKSSKYYPIKILNY